MGEDLEARDGRIAGTHECFDRAEALAVVGPAG
jgi:hypothetical protein